MIRLSKVNLKNLFLLVLSLCLFMILGSIAYPYLKPDEFAQFEKYPRYEITYTASGQTISDKGVGWFTRPNKYDQDLICLPELYRCDGYEYLTQFKNKTLESKVKNCPIQIINVSEEYPEKAYLNLESDCLFSVNESKAIASNYIKIMSPSYQRLRVYMSQNVQIDKGNTKRENYLIIEYSGKDHKTERILKSTNPLQPIISWFSSLWPQSK